MSDFKRYAIYFSPARGSKLAKLGAAWLGWDADAGRDVVPLKVKGLHVPLDTVTHTPRIYGFHGTLKPPFRLREDATFDALDAALSEFSANRSACTIGPMHVRRLSQFVAIVPVALAAELATLAADCVETFDPFRANLTEAELEKRRRANLSDHQEALLTRWGYAYVMDEFRFHLTLSSKLEAAMADHVADVAARVFATALRDPVPVEDVCLFGEREDGRFEIIRRYPLAGQP